MRFLFQSIATVLLAASLIACGGGGDSGGSGGSSNLSLERTVVQGTTDASGRVEFNFSIPGGRASFQMVATSGSGILRLVSLSDPSGRDVTATSTAVSAQENQEGSPSTVNYPYLTGSVPAGSYSAVYRLANISGGATQDVSLTVLSKSDSDSTNGTIKLNFVLVGPANSSQIQSDLDQAVSILEVIFARAGISIDSKWYSFDGPATLPDPRSGTSFYATISEAIRTDAVNVVFGSTVQGLQSPDFRFGRPGAIPGPAVPSTRSAIAISISALTGSDGRFNQNSDRRNRGSTEDNITLVSDNEFRLAAEEIGRLVGNYLGLENIVQISGGRITDTDQLSDTDSCLNLTSCRENDKVRSNLMFPEILVKTEEDRAGEQRREYYLRTEITNQQRTVLNSSVFVD